MHVEWLLRTDMRELWDRLAAWLQRHVVIWFDPDHDWRSIDKLEHLFGGFAVALVLLLAFHMGRAVLGATLVIGFVYECGQADVAHSQHLLGKPGFGIGLLDLFYDGVGALLLLAFRFTLRLL